MSFFPNFANTKLQRAKVNKTMREMIVGYKTDLDSVCYKAYKKKCYYYIV